MGLRSASVNFHRVFFGYHFQEYKARGIIMTIRRRNGHWTSIDKRWDLLLDGEMDEEFSRRGYEYILTSINQSDVHNHAY